MQEVKQRPSDRFAEWFKDIDSILEANYGLSVNDLPDCCFRDWFDHGVSVATAAKRVMRNAQENM